MHGWAERWLGLRPERIPAWLTAGCGTGLLQHGNMPHHTPTA